MLQSVRLPHFLAVVLLVGLFADVADAQTQGPGLGSQAYGSGEHLKAIARLDGAVGVPRGHGFVTMHRGYLLVIFSADGGGGGGTGGFAFLDVSDPRAPRAVFTTEGNPDYARGTPDDAHDIREAHGFSISGDVLCTATNLGQGTGVQFWDIANPLRPRKLSFLALPGLTGGDYSPTPWWVFWQGGHTVYVAGTSGGLYLVDASDPTRPSLVNRGGAPNPIPVSQLGMAQVNVVHAVGNLLVVSNSSDRGLATFDISDPDQPILLDAMNERVGYSMTVNGGLVLGANDPASIFDISDPTQIRVVGRGPNVAEKGGYGAFQDGAFLYGSSSRVVKLDVQTLTSLGTSRPSGFTRPDWDFATPLGNLLYAGNDHGGSALVVHDLNPDTTGPAVNMVSPKDGAVGQAVTTRVGLTFTDQIELESVDTTTFVVRRRGALTPIPGRFSHQLGIVNFWPDRPLAANAVYEVVVPAGGIRDYVGNPSATAFTSLFSTGAAIPTPLQTRVLASPPVEVGSPVTLSAGPVQGAAGAVEYRWDFGDGTATGWSSAPQATHTYAGVAHFRVVLSVRSGGGLQWSAAAHTQTAYAPPTAGAPTTSSTLAYDPVRGRVWAVNPDNDTLSCIDDATHQKLFEVPVGADPRAVGRSPDTTFWVVCRGDSTLRVLHPDDGRQLKQIDLPSGSRPSGLAFRPGGRDVFVSLEATGELAILDADARALVSALAVGPSPRGVAVTGDGRTVFVTRHDSAVGQGELRVIDATAQFVASTSALAHDPGPDTEDSGRGVPNSLRSPVISPDGARAWIPAKKDNVRRGLTRDGLPLTFENAVRAITLEIDPLTGAENTAARVDYNDRNLPSAVAFSPLGDYAFVALQGSNAVEVRDAYDGSRVLAIERTGFAPQGLLVVGDTLYVHHFTGRTLRLYDVQPLLTGASATATAVAEIPTVANERLAPAVLRGKQVFYDSSDPRMALDGYLSCASCHLDGGSDGRVWDFTDRGEGLRNTIDLRGRGGSAQIHWSGNFDEVQDFEHDVRGAFGGLGFMDDMDFRRDGRDTPLGAPKAGVSADLDALAAYVASLDESPASPDRGANGQLTPDAAQGELVFLAQGCADCHSGSRYSDSALGIRHDVGTFGAASGQRLGGVLDGLDTPDLRGLWASAPYFHDGSAASLADVVARSGPLHGDMATLGTGDQRALIAFLRQLDDAVSDAPLSPPGVRLNTPRARATVLGPDVEVEYRKGGDLQGISHARLQLDGLPPRDDLDFDGLHTIPGVQPGAHTLEVWLVDSAGAPVSGTRARQRIEFFVGAELRVTDVRSRTWFASPWATPHTVGVLRNGERVYDDRQVTFTDVGGFSGLPYLQTSNDAKDFDRAAYLRFTVDHPVTVYVAYDARATAFPAWLSPWSDTGRTIQTSDGPRRVLRRELPAGRIVLGGNQAPGAASMYSVILERRSEPLAITDLAPSRSSNAYALGTLALGGDVYTDRSYTFTSVGPLAGLPYVRTANDDKNVRGSDALRLRVNQPVTVYVAYDARATARPRWLSGWRQLAFQIDTTDGPRNVFANAFAGGMLALGGNRAPGADSNYSVVIQLQSQRR